MKKKWETPELIVLVRGKPEEGVLVTCKYPSITAIHADTTNNDCERDNLPTSACMDCHSWASS